MNKVRQRKWIRVVLPLVVVVVSIGAVKYVLDNKPEARRGRAENGPVVRVEAARVEPTQFQVELDSYGVVKPRTESQLIPQISGQVVSISEQFREGAFFEAGEVLIKIDDRDYRADLEVARAQLVEAELRLSEEQARAQQAERDWRRLGQGEPSDLALRRPQVAAARAAIASAKARRTTAELNLERTEIRAPYAGRVLSKSVDLGQVVSPGSVVAEIYAVDYVEVRLPLNSRQRQFIDLPEQYRDGALSSANQPPVTLEATLGNRSYRWLGRVVRVEGAIDSATRQLFVVAQVEDPYGRNTAGNPPLKIGQFVRAQIQGHLLNNVFVLPRDAVRQDNRVMVVEQGRLQTRRVRTLWRDEQFVVVDEGLETGDVVSLTPLGTGAEGALVNATIDGQPLQPTRVGRTDASNDAPDSAVRPAG